MGGVFALDTHLQEYEGDAAAEIGVLQGRHKGANH